MKTLKFLALMLTFTIFSCERDSYQELSDIPRGPCVLTSAGTIKGDISVSSGTSVTIVTVDDTYPPRYRINWQSSVDGTNFTDIEGATYSRNYTDTYKTTTWIRKRTNDCAILYSNSVKITVN